MIEADGYAPVTMDLVVAVLPEQNLLAQEKRYAPLVEYLGERLGLHMTVELRLLPDYGKVIKSGKLANLRLRLMQEVTFVLEAFENVHEAIGDRPWEIHIDINGRPEFLSDAGRTLYGGGGNSGG